MTESSIRGNLPEKLAICVAFHFVAERLQYLDMISDHFSDLSQDLTVFIVTNSSEGANLEQIRGVLDGKGFEYDFFIPTGLGHPFLLTWSHFAVFRDLINEETITHFMYLEDDILVNRTNMEYWMAAREDLRRYNFIPSFLRVEKKHSEEGWYSSDAFRTHKVGSLPTVKLATNPNRVYVNLPTPYQGMYLLDRELMLEHLNGKSSIPEYCKKKWGIREMAAQGLTFKDVRKHFTSRNLVPFSVLTGEIDDVCFIHHTPNNYANRTYRLDHPIGTIPVKKLLQASD